MFFKTYGLLGQNARNLKYIKGFNSKMARKLADSKLQTKEFLKSKKIPVPKTLAVLKNHGEITDDLIEKLETPFVIKPNAGFGGKGIIVIDSRDSSGNFVANTKKIYTPKEIKTHLLNIIDGFYSLSGNRDKVIIEKKIEINDDVQILGKYGLPDIRIICFNMVPVIAMLRIPTEKSSGKANLHAGACAAGIDIGSGKLTYLTQYGKIIKSVPGIGDIRGLVLPDWDKMLEMAVGVQKETGIGYLGCDIVMDKRDGPLLLEINIRPGLEVQVANLARLKDRLERVEGVNINSVEKGVRLGKDLFSGDIEGKIEKLSGKKVVGQREYIVLQNNDKKYKYLAEIDTGKTISVIDKKFLENILKIDKDKLDAKKIRLKAKILTENKTINFSIKKLDGVNIILGLNSLKGFLIDPFKYKKLELPISYDDDYKNTINSAVRKNYEKQLLELDEKLINIDKKLLILKNITPLNIKEEKEKFIKSKGEYIPKFKYNKLKIDFEQLEKNLDNIEISDIPLSNIFKRKKEEILNKINYLKAFNKGDSENQTKYSKLLFGDIIEDNLDFCKQQLKKRDNIKQEKEFIGFEEIKKYVNKFNHIYQINISVKKANKTSRFVMSGDTLLVNENVKVGKKETRSIIAHEIEGHYLRRLNGRKLKYKIFSRGTAGYIIIDEAIAIYNQNRFLNEQDEKYYRIFEGYYFLNYAKKHSYNKLIEKLAEFYNYDFTKVFDRLLRIKRGFQDIEKQGVFYKDVVYLNGYKEILDFLEKGGSLKELYLGKINIEDLEEMKQSYFMKLDFINLKTPFFL